MRKDNELEVSGYWTNEPEYVVTVTVSLGTWNGEEGDDYIFYYTDGEDIKVGDTIAGDFVVLEIER